MNPEILVKLQSMKVLFIDDEENILNLVSGLFTDLEVSHETASNGQIALNMILEKKDTDEQYDLIITDINIELETLQKKLAKYKQVKQGLMQVLLIGKVILFLIVSHLFPFTSLLKTFSC